MHRLRIPALSLLCVSLVWCARHTATTWTGSLVVDPGPLTDGTAGGPTPCADQSASAGRPLVPFEQLLDGGRAPVAFCFWPGTDPAVMAYYEQLMHTPPDGQRYFLGGRWSGVQGGARALTWSFVPDGLAVDGGTSELFSRMDALFGGNRALWISRFEVSFARWAQLIGVSYTRITTGGNDWDDGTTWGFAGSSTRGDIRIAMIPIDGAYNVLGYSYYPSNGDTVLDRAESWNSPSNNYRFLRQVFIHEHGHGIGIAHVCSNNSNQLMEPELSTAFDGPQDDDMRAGQRHYGDRYEPNDTSATAYNLGTAQIGTPINLGLNIPSPSIPYASMLTLDANGEEDYFKFTTTDARSAAVTITPIGRTYDSSPEVDGSCTCCNNISSLTRANLNVQVLGTDGSTVLATAASQPAGVAETISAVYLPLAGTYYIKVYEGDAPTEAQFYRLTLTVATLDCNNNGTLDPCDISCAAPGCTPPNCGGSLDCNGNGLPDECELGPNDCNNNGKPDDCDIASGTSRDCQLDGTPDECQLTGNDCNVNTTPDECDIVLGTSRDCQPDGTPDECQLAGNDCNANTTPDECDTDCNANGHPDDCDLASGTSTDCTGNGIPDECETDCNTNGVRDDCDLLAGTSRDCNSNGRPDECDAEHCHYLWNGFQGLAYSMPMNGLDIDGDGVAWSNPADSAKIWLYGCEGGSASDRAVQVTVTTDPPEDGYVVSEYFRSDAGTLYPDEVFYTLSFKPRFEGYLNPKTDWQFTLYDAVRTAAVVQIHFASTVSQYPGIVIPNDRGYILVKNPSASPVFINTGVAVSLAHCYDFKVVLDNTAGTVQLYIDGVARLNPALPVLVSDARRTDYFRVQAVANGAGSGGTTAFKLDAFHLCALGSILPPTAWDCNGNRTLDACDVASGVSYDCNANGVPEECEKGDFNGDQTVNLTDYQTFQSCFTGPGGSLGGGCGAGDFDCDNDIDLRDFAWFQLALPVR